MVWFTLSCLPPQLEFRCPPAHAAPCAAMSPSNSRRRTVVVLGVVSGLAATAAVLLWLSRESRRHKAHDAGARGEAADGDADDAAGLDPPGGNSRVGDGLDDGAAAAASAPPPPPTPENYDAGVVSETTAATRVDEPRRSRHPNLASDAEGMYVPPWERRFGSGGSSPSADGSADSAEAPQSDLERRVAVRLLEEKLRAESIFGPAARQREQLRIRGEADSLSPSKSRRHAPLGGMANEEQRIALQRRMRKKAEEKRLLEAQQQQQQQQERRQLSPRASKPPIAMAAAL